MMRIATAQEIADAEKKGDESFLEVHYIDSLINEMSEGLVKVKVSSKDPRTIKLTYRDHVVTEETAWAIETLVLETGRYLKTRYNTPIEPSPTTPTEPQPSVVVPPWAQPAQ